MLPNFGGPSSHVWDKLFSNKLFQAAKKAVASGEKPLFRYRFA
jgi:hypothetical protein